VPCHASAVKCDDVRGGQVHLTWRVAIRSHEDLQNFEKRELMARSMASDLLEGKGPPNDRDMRRHYLTIKGPRASCGRILQ